MNVVHSGGSWKTFSRRTWDIGKRVRRFNKYISIPEVQHCAVAGLLLRGRALAETGSSSLAKLSLGRQWWLQPTGFVLRALVWRRLVGATALHPGQRRLWSVIRLYG